MCTIVVVHNAKAHGSQGKFTPMLIGALRKSLRGKYVDYYAGELLKIQDGTLTRSGGMLQVSGIDQSDWKYKFFNGNFKSEITDGMTPRDPAVLDAAMALVE